MVLNYVEELDFDPPEASIQRAIGYVEGLTSKRDGLFKIVRDPDRMREVRAKVMQILATRSDGRKQRIGVYLSKARRNPYLQSGVYIPEDGDINRQAAKMG
jgi:hypothetical protein